MRRALFIFAALVLMLALPAVIEGQTHTVLVTWTAASGWSGPTLINVYRAVTPSTSCAGMSWTQIATGQPAGGPYTDLTVLDGVNYCYEVRCYLATNPPADEIATSNWAFVGVPEPKGTKPMQLRAVPQSIAPQ